MKKITILTADKKNHVKMTIRYGSKMQILASNSRATVQVDDVDSGDTPPRKLGFLAERTLICNSANCIINYYIGIIAKLNCKRMHLRRGYVNQENNPLLLRR